MERSYSHRSREDILELRERFSGLSDNNRAAIICYTMLSGIVKAPLLARLSLKMMCKRFGNKQGTQQFMDMLSGSPKQLNVLWDGAMGWMTEGKDEFDKLSAGGWNKAELDGLLDFVDKTGMFPEVPAEEKASLSVVPVI